MMKPPSSWSVVAGQPAQTFPKAAKGLRAHLKVSQQSMAALLGISFAALRTHETGTVENPDARIALAYMIVAENYGCPDLVEAFASKLCAALGLGILGWRFFGSGLDLRVQSVSSSEGRARG